MGIRKPNKNDKKYKLPYRGFDWRLFDKDEKEWYEATRPKTADTRSVLQENGNTSTYFGGRKDDGSYKADGTHHGHVVTDSSGNVRGEREAGPGETFTHYPDGRY